VQQVRFGIAGLKDPKDLEASVALLVGGDFAACEVQFVKEFTLKEREAEKLGELARDAGITLSVHAPYFAALTTKDPDRLKLHVGALHHSSKLAQLMGAKIVVCHPGTADADPEELHDRVGRALESLAPRIADTGVKLGLETCGRRSQFGTLGDIAVLVSRYPFTAPVIDFAHIHALSEGKLVSPAAFEALFAYIVENFSFEHFWPLHGHFTDNRFGPAGEITHVPYGEGSLRISNLIKGAEGFDLALTIVSEERWQESHRLILEELRGVQAPLAGAAERSRASASGSEGATEKENGWLPGRLRLQRQPGAHFYSHRGREVRITNVDKPFFPDEGYTKGDLADFYYRVSPLMLPFLKDRPIVMQRVPEGIYGEPFYEKQVPKGAPDWVRTVPVPSDEGRRIVDYVVVDDVTTLLWLAQIASVECHAWTSRWPNLEEPDFAVIDLDPHEPIGFEDVRTVAKLVKVVLDNFRLRGFVKTSGGAGLQVFVPLVPGHTYPEVRAFCAAVGHSIRPVYPDKVTLEPSKPKRTGKVFIDANQNAKGKTLVAPYSVRPYPGATVSTPLFWEELDQDFFPEQFTIATVIERVQEVGDPFRPALFLRQDLHPILKKLK
jgi:bifunctional non-homologous end joining protein LigD